MQRDPRVVVVHERFTEPGGSERVVEQLVEATGASRVFAPIVDPDTVPAGMLHVPITVSGLQRLYPGGRGYAALLPLLARAMERADVSDADVVVVSHHAFANRVPVPDGIPMISYTHTPARWMWDEEKLGLEAGFVQRLVLGGFARRQREADREAARRPDVVLVNSTAVAERVRRWWGRSSVVVPPPVDVDWYTPDPATPRGDFFLWAGRLVPYKRPEVAVLAARRAGVPLVVAGEGRARRAVERLAGPQTVFLGRVDDIELRRLFRACRALVFPGEEDFGIVPVEAQGCGAPVIALDAGGAVDTVGPETGIRVRPAGPSLEDHVQAFASAMRALHPDAYDPEVLRAAAERFSAQRFQERVKAVVDRVLDDAPVRDVAVA